MEGSQRATGMVTASAPVPSLVAAALWDSTRCGVFVKDTSFRYLQVNAALARFISTSPAAVVGRHDGELFGTARAAYLRYLDQRVLRGETIEDEISLTRCGRPLTLRISAAPARDAADHILGIVGIALDVTEHDRVEQILLERLTRRDACDARDPRAVVVPHESEVNAAAAFSGRIGHEVAEIAHRLFGYADMSRTAQSPADSTQFLRAAEKLADIARHMLGAENDKGARMHNDLGEPTERTRPVDDAGPSDSRGRDETYHVQGIGGG